MVEETKESGQEPISQTRPDDKRLRHFAKLNAKWKQFVGIRTVLCSNRGVVFAGRVVELDHGVFRFEDVTMTTRGKRLTPPFVYVHSSTIAHIHPEVTVEERLEPIPFITAFGRRYQLMIDEGPGAENAAEAPTPFEDAEEGHDVIPQPGT